MKASLTAIAAMTVSAQSVLAGTVEYKCEITKPDGHGWIAPEYNFQVDTDTREAKVVSCHHDWTSAQLKVKKSGEYRMFWNVTLRSSEGQNLRMKYQANLNSAKNTVKVRASFAHTSAANKPYGSGVCSVFTG
ncbi:hypothetical protein [Ruegeria atlantica]|uniref:Uncharacterized protein n=1 Tax=Ruegeria atlantica TaxID=81569 RepID=A0A0P1F4B1_9RHOB|nr:hypothetical protein [Ruegeria atlantica]CUH48822.1 hypothetical protein RUA4292_03012 [Ruegeria atlantica]